MTDDEILNPVQGDGRFAATLPFFGGHEDLGREPADRRRSCEEVGALFARREVHAQLHALLAAQDADHLSRDDAVVRRHGRRAGLPRHEACARRCATTALRGIEATQFFPAWGKARLHGMIANRPDWTLSRQRQWGMPLPFFVDRETDELHPDTLALLELAAAKVEAGGIEAWFEATSEDFGVDEARYRKLTDTLDVWFDSGTTHQTVMGGPDGRATGAGSHPQQTGFPADLYLEGSDQHRGWFHSSLLTSCMLNGVPPYKALLTHGFAVDGEGRKMSKSKGNVVAPQKVADTLGAEILRLWVGATDYSGELSISDEILKRVVESYRRIRNTLRFLLANTADFDRGARRGAARPSCSRSTASRSQTRRAMADAVAADYARYEFHLVVQRLQTYCSEDLGGFYLDVLKDRLYTAAADSAARRSAQTALALIRDALLKLMAPILSFTAEEAWRILQPGRSDDLRAHLGADAARRRRRRRAGGASGARSSRVRALVQKELEAVRQAGAIGSSLQAEVDIVADADDIRRARIARRRPALRADHVGGARHAAATRSSITVDAERASEMRALLALARRRRRRSGASGLCGRCVANLYGAASRAGSRDRMETVERDRPPREPSRRTLRWLWLSRRRDRRSTS